MRRKSIEDSEEFPLSNWKMESIFDERDQMDDYWKGLKRRIGHAAEEEIERFNK